MKLFYETMDEFKPTEKLLNLVSNLPKPDLAVHLRRQDKVRTNPDLVSINYNDLEELNKITMETVEKLASNKILYIASDDELEKYKYQNKFNSIIDTNEYISYERTYVDLYMMSISNYIILSQRHSNFSLLASLMNRSKLIYFYEECLINEFNFNLLDNIIYYKNL
jgi:hypothetical protein